jgi:hypothetical protein
MNKKIIAAVFFTCLTSQSPWAMEDFSPTIEECKKSSQPSSTNHIWNNSCVLQQSQSMPCLENTNAHQELSLHMENFLKENHDPKTDEHVKTFQKYNQECTQQPLDTIDNLDFHKKVTHFLTNCPEFIHFLWKNNSLESIIYKNRNMEKIQRNQTSFLLNFSDEQESYTSDNQKNSEAPLKQDDDGNEILEESISPSKKLKSQTLDQNIELTIEQPQNEQTKISSNKQKVLSDNYSENEENSSKLFDEFNFCQQETQDRLNAVLMDLDQAKEALDAFEEAKQRQEGLNDLLFEENFSLESKLFKLEEAKQNLENLNGDFSQKIIVLESRLVEREEEMQNRLNAVLMNLDQVKKERSTLEEEKQNLEYRNICLFKDNVSLNTQLIESEKEADILDEEIEQLDGTLKTFQRKSRRNLCCLALTSIPTVMFCLRWGILEFLRAQKYYSI